MPKIKVSISDYWDYFWQQFNSEYYESNQTYADYDECWIKTKKLVDSQIYTSYSRDLYRWSQDDSGGTIGIMELIYLFQGGGTNPDTGQQYGGNIFISFL